jgi:hypothetical protein
MAAEVQDFARRFEELFELFGVTLDKNELEQFVFKLESLQVFGNLIDQIKYTMNLVFNTSWEIEEMPKNQTDFLGIYLFPLRVRTRIVHLKTKMHRLGAQTLINTLFQGFKKGLMPTHPNRVFNSVKDNKEALGTQKETPDRILDRMEELLSEISDEIRVESTLYRRGYNWNRPISRKATVESSFGNGGNVGFLSARFHSENTLSIPSFLGYVSRGLEIRAVYSLSATRMELLGEALLFNDQKYQAIPACILEPMKTRLITKPSACLHLGLGQIQKVLWNYLYNHESGFFRLIGEPLERNHLDAILGDWKVGERFCNGDFKATTDNINLDVSKLVAQKILGGLCRSNPLLYARAIRSLTDMEIDYTKTVMPSYPFSWDKDRALESLGQIHQENGQLMGNIISFPILCIANYLAYHISCEDSKGARIPLWGTRPVLINGDDILFVTSTEGYAVWRRTCSECGLYPSVGKNFYTSRFIQINSELWVPRYGILQTGDRGQLFGVVDIHKVPYVNFGLMCQRRKQDCSEDYSIISPAVMRTGLQQCIDEDYNLPSWVQRARSLMKIKENLLEPIRFISKGKLHQICEKFFRRHTGAIFETLGLSRFNSSKYCDWYMGQAISHTIIVEPNLALELFPSAEEEKIMPANVSIRRGWKGYAFPSDVPNPVWKKDFAPDPIVLDQDRLSVTSNRRCGDDLGLAAWMDGIMSRMDLTDTNDNESGVCLF